MFHPFATLRTVACQAPLSMGFFRQEYWSGLPCSPPWYLSKSEIEPASRLSPALAGGFFTTSACPPGSPEQPILTLQNTEIKVTSFLLSRACILVTVCSHRHVGIHLPKQNCASGNLFRSDVKSIGHISISKKIERII